MGGVGKTTLAQMVYKHETVVNHFEMKAWTCVSEVFDIMGVTKAVLESVTSQPCDLKTLDQVQVKLNQALRGKKFLIVLDDVWNKNHGDWSSLKSPFNDGAPGSKVIVTTRNRDVALMMTGTDKYHSLKELSDDDCWSVFAQHALENRSIDESPNLFSIGREIVKKCGGLPLAARTLGGLLRCKFSDDEWNEVLNSKIWELSDQESKILLALRLSYYHLPSHLKKCFAYCSVIPHDYKFEEKELVLWWMAEGLIQKPPGRKQMEDLGREYFRELLSRSFFQLSSSGDGEVSRFVMHDLISDLAQFVAKRIYFRLENKPRDNDEGENIAKARYSSYMRVALDDDINRFEAFRNAKNLRTFLPFRLTDALSDGDDWWPHRDLTSNVPLYLLRSLRRLRVLSFKKYAIRELPSSIGDLKHVRYLDLSHTLILLLPKSIGTLYNLQTLILRYCTSLKELPTNTANLINLRHLDVTGAWSLQEMPPKFGKLTSLQTLSNFIVGKGDGSTINELGNLVHLGGTLCISGLENALDDTRASLKDKQGLVELSMKWSNISDASRSESVEFKVLDMLEPHRSIQKLTLSGYHGLTFPSWVGNSLFSNIVHLKFENCKKCTSLPPLGQLSSLAKLYIRGLTAVENVGLEFCGLRCSNPFASLEILSFEDMPEWKDWSPVGVEESIQAFARLLELSVKNCPKLLHKLPSNLPRLRKLDIMGCPLLLVAWVPSPREPNEVRNVLHLDSLTSLSQQNVSIQHSFHHPKVGDGAVLENGRFSDLSSLTSLRIENIQGLTCLPSWFFQGLTGLQELFLRRCEDLTSLWKNEARQQHRLPSLKRLVIERCSQLVSLFEEDEKEEVEELQQHEEEVPYIMMLEYLIISDCSKLEKLPQGLHNVNSLQELIIRYCPCLMSFPKKGLPSTLKRLEIWDCDALRSLPELMMLSSLENLDIKYCQSLAYLSSNGLPLTLKQLVIQFCEKLESILAEEGIEINCPVLESVEICECKSLKSLPNAMQNNCGCLRNLTKLDILECDNLESIPEGWFAATNMRDLCISGCKKLEALPHHVYNNHLTSLEMLSLDSCAATTELLSCILKEGSSSFTNLTNLVLDNVEVGKPLSEWGLHRLSSHRDLILLSYGWASFPEDGMPWLPPYLISLGVNSFQNLEKLSCKEFQKTASLKCLHISYCEKLTSITELGQLSSLSTLWTWGCPNLLASFAEQGLPPSLVEWRIRRCPKLKQGFEKGKVNIGASYLTFLR